MKTKEQILDGLHKCTCPVPKSCFVCPYYERPDNFPQCSIDLCGDALALIREMEKTINELYGLLEETCKDFREKVGEDDVCGLCLYEGCAYRGEEDWCGWCPGFDGDDCFVMSNEIRKMCGKEILPDPGPQ